MKFFIFLEKKNIWAQRFLFLEKNRPKKSKFKSGFRHISIPDCSRLRSIKKYFILFFGQILKMGCHLVNYIPLGMLATDTKSINTLNIPTPSVCTVATKFQGFFFGSQFLSIGDQRKERGLPSVCTKESFWDKKGPKSPYFEGGGKKRVNFVIFRL